MFGQLDNDMRRVIMGAFGALVFGVTFLAAALAPAQAELSTSPMKAAVAVPLAEVRG